MPLVLSTAPTGDPVSLADIKAHVREDTSDNDAWLTAAIKSAVAYLDGPKGILNQCIMPQQWQAFYDAFPAGSLLKINIGPVTALTKFEYQDASGTWTDVLGSTYISKFTDGDLQIALNSGASWPTPKNTVDCVRVTFTAGYANAASVPADLVMAIKMMVAHWFENRGVILDDRRVESLPFVVDALIAKHRRIAY